MNQIQRCEICGKNYFGPECPNCGMQEPAVEEQKPQPDPAQKISVVGIDDPLAAVIWELLKHIPNGTIEDAIMRARANLNTRDGMLKIDRPEWFSLAAHCVATANKIRGMKQ